MSGLARSQVTALRFLFSETKVSFKQKSFSLSSLALPAPNLEKTQSEMIESFFSNRKSTTCRKLGTVAGATATAACMYKIGVDHSIGTSSKKGIKGVIENLKNCRRNMKNFILTENGKSVADGFGAIKKNSKTYKNLVKIFNTKLGRAGFVATAIAVPLMIGAAIGKVLGGFCDKAISK